MAEVVVIGAGPAGLMAALQASRRGHSCTLLEAGPHVGGMAGSFEVAGQRVDYGSHRLHPATPERFLRLLRSLLGPGLQTRQRRGRILLHGRWVGFPLRTVDMLRNLPPSFTARAALDAAAAPLRGRVGGRGPSFEDEVVRRLGPTVARGFYAPYALKLYGVAAPLLHRELADRRISASGAGDVLKRLVRSTRQQGRAFLYPERGYGQISEALAEAAAAAGTVLRLKSPAVGLEARDGGVRVLVGRDGSDGETTAEEDETASAGRSGRSGRSASALEADVVLSTMPAAVLARVVAPAPPPDVVAALALCRSRAMLLVYLVVEQPRYTPCDAHYFPGPETRMSRLSEPKNYRDGEDPPDRTVLCAEIPCWRGEEVWELDDDRLAALVADDMQRAGLGRPEPAGVEVRRLRSVYPVYETATMAARAAVDAWTRSLTRSGIAVLGRQGLAVPDNLHHVLAMGEAAAQAVGADGKIDSARWSDALDGFAGHVVED